MHLKRDFCDQHTNRLPDRMWPIDERNVCVCMYKIKIVNGLLLTAPQPKVLKAVCVSVI